MSNLPQSLPLNPPLISPNAASVSTDANSAQSNKDCKMASSQKLVLDLSNPALREKALVELSKKREIFQDLAPLLWNSFGTMTVLIQELITIYSILSSPNLPLGPAVRVCNALALLQCVAAHSETRMSFLNAQIPMYIYPFLNTAGTTRPFEYLRLSSLGIIGALVKVEDTEVISFLLSTKIMQACLLTMEKGSELSRTVATYIVQKIILHDVGLNYICTTPKELISMRRVLGIMVHSLVEQPSPRLLKHIIRCYLRLSDNPSACNALRDCLPKMLRDSTFHSCLHDDPATIHCLQLLLHNVTEPGEVTAPHSGEETEHISGNSAV